jgi:hypothetical protein
MLHNSYSPTRLPLASGSVGPLGLDVYAGTMTTFQQLKERGNSSFQRQQYDQVR